MPSRKVVLIVVDGLTPGLFEHAVETGRAPALAYLAEHGRYRRSVSTFPSLTPVCLSSIATGAHPDVHEIPHLVWWNRRERRLVEYGSSFGAILAAGFSRSVLDTIYDMNARHLSRRAVTLYEAVEDTGRTAAAVNITCYRGRHKHLPRRIPGATKPAYGPKRFFFYSLFESDVTGAPLAVRNRAAGTIDAYAATVGRWLVTRDGFDCLVYYLSDLDYASHAHGPDDVDEALARVDAGVGTLLAAAGGPDEFLDRYAVVVCSDHGQTAVERTATLRDHFPDAIVAASNRAGMIYGDDPRALAERLDGHPAVETAMFLEDGEAIARRDGVDVPLSELGYPDGPARIRAALANPNAGEVILSAASGWEFADLGGRHHAGGGSHGSLTLGDSEVPMLTVGMGAPPESITGVAPAILDHLGIPLPPYVRSVGPVR
ncbi:MAG TPA: nucleotide pyrophosphatase/phosphodiesterase family protein [Gaiellaceae bacterium]|nr:nucleotide pyrophosphatase/phosphodiesterase family protein [Gaiellaceae bacterium]